MAGAASAHQAVTASSEQNSQQRAVRTRRTSADPQRAQQGATAAAAAAPAALDSLSRLQHLADASPRVAQLRRLQALADGRFDPVAQLAGGPEEELIQGQFATAELQPQLQQAPRANNTGLPDQLKSGIESLSGLSLDHVRVHYNSSQPAQLNALAYAQGSDIHLAPGQERHLPHEAWHVVQQAQGRVHPTLQLKDGVQVNDDVGLEREADLMGGRAVMLKQQTVQRHKLEHDRTASEAALKAKANTKYNSGAENTQFTGFIAQLSVVKKKKKGNLRTIHLQKQKHKRELGAKATKKVSVRKINLKVKNQKDTYETEWRNQLSRATGVEDGPRKEAAKLSEILGKKCIGGHMINDRMGGPGDFSNIIPITATMNSAHKKIENKITHHFSDALPHETDFYQYKMVVSGRRFHKTDRGKVENWPTEYVNSYQIIDSSGKKKAEGESRNVEQI